MGTIIETELKDVLSKLDQRLDRIEADLTILKLGQVELKGDIKTLDEKVSGDIKTLDEKVSGDIKTLDEKISGDIKTLNEKVSGVSKRLENLEFIIRSVIGGVVVAAVVGFAKYLGLFPELK
jgi:chaperonin cofactor prefoldin